MYYIDVKEDKSGCVIVNVGIRVTEIIEDFIHM